MHDILLNLQGFSILGGISRLKAFGSTTGFFETVLERTPGLRFINLTQLASFPPYSLQVIHYFSYVLIVTVLCFFLF